MEYCINLFYRHHPPNQILLNIKRYIPSSLLFIHFKQQLSIFRNGKFIVHEYHAYLIRFGRYFVGFVVNEQGLFYLFLNGGTF